MVEGASMSLCLLDCHGETQKEANSPQYGGAAEILMGGRTLAPWHQLSKVESARASSHRVGGFASLQPSHSFPYSWPLGSFEIAVAQLEEWWPRLRPKGKPQQG